MNFPSEKDHWKKIKKTNVTIALNVLYAKKEIYSAYNTISLSHHEQVSLSGFDGRSISRNVVHLKLLVHDVINLLYYEY